MSEENMNCKNFEICKNTYPKNYHNCWGGTCIQCDLNFGSWKKDGSKGLEFIDFIECCCCLEINKRGVKFPKCEHYTCVECFKELWKAVLDPDSYELVDHRGIKWSNNILKEHVDIMASKMIEKGITVNKNNKYEDVNEYYRQCLFDLKLHESENLRKCPLCRE